MDLSFFESNNLETNRLIIRDYTQGDYPALIAAIREMFDYKFSNVEPDYKIFLHFDNRAPDYPSEEHIKKVADYYMSRVSQALNETPRTGFWRGIFSKDDGSYIGHVGICVIPEGDHGAYSDFSYYSNPKYGKNGYILEACKKTLEEYFKYFDAVEVTTHPENKLSIKLLNKLGAVQTRYVEHYHYYNEPRFYFKITKEAFYEAIN